MTNKKPILSICIPNYGRPKLLKKNLESIAPQLNSQVEIVISDDASSEDITQIINHFKAKYPKSNLSYVRQKNNLGFDKNVLAVVKQASGEFCWLLSNDDQILRNSIKHILTLVKRHPKLSLILVNYSRYDKVLGKITASKMINLRKSKLFFHSDKFFFYPTPKSYFKYLGVNTITMSSDIFRRSYWLKSSNKLAHFIKHNFIHVFILVDIIKKYPFIYFEVKPRVQYLSNNHRVWPNNIWKDYNSILLNWLIDLGYNRQSIQQMRSKQKEYEVREAFTKIKFIPTLYQIARFIFVKTKQIIRKI